MKYLLIVPIDKDKYKVKIDKYLDIEPIEIETPVGYILPDCLLENEKVVKKLKPRKLEVLELINEEDIIFFKEDIL